MDIEIKSNESGTKIYIDGEEVPRATMVMFYSAVGVVPELIYEQYVIDENGKFIIEDDRVKRVVIRR